MTTTIEVKNGVIKLPADLKKRLDNKKILLNQYGDSIYITPIEKVEVPESTKALMKISGMLKGRVTKDPAKWQKKIRKEWDRKLP